MRTVVIGGTGHIGTYLIPRLVASGHEVLNVSRSVRTPYRNHSAWSRVKNIELDRSTEERSGRFGKEIRDLRPDVVIDLICFTLESAEHLVSAALKKRENSSTTGPATVRWRPCSNLWRG